MFQSYPINIKNKVINIKAYGPASLFSLADPVNKAIRELKGSSGLVHFFSVGSTGCLTMLGDDAVRTSFKKAVMKKMPWREFHRHPGNAFAHIRSSVLGNELWMSATDGNIDSNELGPFLLENTAGRKRRSLVFTILEADGMKDTEFTVEANGWIDIVNISWHIDRFIAGLGNGIVFVETNSPGTALLTIEYEPALLLDTADFFAGIFADIITEHKAGVSAAFLPQSLAIPFRDGRTLNGVWQQIALIDFSCPGAKKIKARALADSIIDE